MAHHGRPLLRGLALFALPAVFLFACGEGSEEGAGTEDPGAPYSAEPPELAPVDERHPEMFDEQGCLRVADGEVDCTSRRADIDEALAEDPETVRELRGFVGSGWATELSGEFVLLESSLSVTDEGAWAARGLARNERPAQVGSLVVGAQLLGADGEVLADLEAPSPVSPVRPGEPVPFALSAEDVPAAEVVDVRWSLAEGEASGRVRDLEIAEFWTRGFAEPRSAESYLYDDTGEPQSHVRFGSVTNLTGGPLEEVTVVVAWLSDDGKVMAVARGAAVPVRPEDDLDGAAPQLLEDPPGEAPEQLDDPGRVGSDAAPPVTEQLGDIGEAVEGNPDDAVVDGPRAAPGRPALEPNASADFVIVVAAGSAPAAIDDAVVYLWAVGL